VGGADGAATVAIPERSRDARSKTVQIVILEREPDSLRAATGALRGDGYDLLVARDGEEAIDLLRTTHCRVIIARLRADDRDTLELCREIRSCELPEYAYVLLLLDEETRVGVIDALAAGADDFITLPCAPDRLRASVHAALALVGLQPRDEAVFAMARMAQLRDPATRQHGERMSSFVRVLAEHLCGRGVVDDRFVEQLGRAAPLHDVGKLAVPKCVLLKRGKLSDAEFALIQTHASLGAEMLEAAECQYPGVAYLGMARQIALTHHERVNGHGYPVGRIGEEIPLCGRIVGLADTYDALTSTRSYRPAFAIEVARELILEQAGEAFDPLVVEAFMANEPAFAAIRGRHSRQAAVLA
jgi:putative two-component system response regulator